MRGSSHHSLTPEEDAIDDLIGEDDDVDDTLPADLWFRRRSSLTERPRGLSIWPPKDMR
ncbi:MAG TPA: hypothetical protein VFL82_14790 [Thermomicrobiales bacterium]|jgi:hypothetical protein|nr:hypothetical protein [Thermomicrobiales bacterium]